MDEEHIAKFQKKHRTKMVRRQSRDALFRLYGKYGSFDPKDTILNLLVNSVLTMVLRFKRFFVVHPIIPWSHLRAQLYIIAGFLRFGISNG